MRRLLSCFLVFLCATLWMSCNKEKDHAAARAALTYYTYLIEGRYADYVNAIAYSDSMPEGYKSQMVDLMAQYAAREKEQRGGLVGAKVVGDTIVGQKAHVFLEVTYGDGTCEEVALPMVLCGDTWRMQ